MVGGEHLPPGASGDGRHGLEVAGQVAPALDPVGTDRQVELATQSLEGGGGDTGSCADPPAHLGLPSHEAGECQVVDGVGPDAIRP